MKLRVFSALFLFAFSFGALDIPMELIKEFSASYGACFKKLCYCEHHAAGHHGGFCHLPKSGEHEHHVGNHIDARKAGLFISQGSCNKEKTFVFSASSAKQGFPLGMLTQPNNEKAPGYVLQAFEFQPLLSFPVEKPPQLPLLSF